MSEVFTPTHLVVYAALFVFVGLPIGSVLGSWLALRDSCRNTPGKTVRPSVDHVAELLKHNPPFVVYVSAKLCVFYRLLFQKVQLLLKQGFLKAVGNPAAKQDAEHGDACTRNEGRIVHAGSVAGPGDVQQGEDDVWAAEREDSRRARLADICRRQKAYARLFNGTMWIPEQLSESAVLALVDVPWLLAQLKAADRRASEGRAA
jgi:hypothetical protein